MQALDDAKLPIYTILIPVFREKEVLPILLKSLAELDYPQSKLDIKLLLEEVDQETREAAIKIDPPGNIEFITIPDSPAAHQTQSLQLRAHQRAREISGHF